MRNVLAILVLPCLLASANGRAEEKKPDPDEEHLRKAGIATDDAGLRKYLRECAEYDAKVRRIPALIRQLGAKEFQEREKAAAELIAVGPPALGALKNAGLAKDAEIARRAKACVEQIQKITGGGSDSRGRFRWEGQAVLRVLLRRGMEDDAVKGFVAALLSPDPEVYRETVNLILKSVKYPLLELGHPSRSKELRVLRRKLAPIMAEVIAGREAPDQTKRAAATDALTQLGWFELQARLEKLKKASTPKDCIKKIEALSGQILLAKGIVPVLLPYLKHENADVRAAAAEALGHMVPEAEQVVPALVAALEAADAKIQPRRNTRATSVREQVAYSLAEFELLGNAAIPALLKSTRDEKPLVRKASAIAVGRIGPSQPEVVNAVRRILDDKSPTARYGAIWAVYWIGAPAEPLVPRLIELFKEPGEEENKGGRIPRFAVLMALASIGPRAKTAIPFLVQQVENNPRNRQHALQTLAEIGPVAATGALPVLLRLLGDERAKDHRGQLIRTLGRFGPAAKPAVPLLVAVVKDKKQKYREAAAYALIDIEPEAGKAMLEILRRENPRKE